MFFHHLHFSAKFWFLVVAAEMSCLLFGAYCTLKSLVSPQMAEQSSASLCAYLHAGTAVRDVAAHLSERMSLTLSTLQFKTILELPCTEKWSTLLWPMNLRVKIALSGSTRVELWCFLLFMLGWPDKVQQWGIVDGRVIFFSLFMLFL